MDVNQYPPPATDSLESSSEISTVSFRANVIRIQHKCIIKKKKKKKRRKS